jgi:hypothetical protein
MTLVTLKDRSVIDVVIRSADQPDIANLSGLNKKWQKTALSGNIKDGYIGAAFSDVTFSELISRDQVIVAYFNDALIGYYLLNDFSKDGVIGRHAEIVAMLKKGGKIAAGAKICVGAQVVVDSAFMGSGVRWLMLSHLMKNVEGVYDYLFGTIAKDNHRGFTAHTRDGWKVIDEDEDLYCVLYKG